MGMRGIGRWWISSEVESGGRLLGAGPGRSTRLPILGKLYVLGSWHQLYDVSLAC